MHASICTLLSICTLIGIAATARAQESRIDVGVGIAIDAADGEPANDIPNAGLFSRYKLNDRWMIGAAINRAEYDYERPAEIVGITQDPTVEVIDALATATIVRAWIERSLTDERRPMQFFVGVGVGAAFTDVPDAAGPRADGGRFDIHTEVDTEILASVIGGARLHFREHWYGETAVRLEHHFADWQSVDRISGTRGAIDDYLTWGIQISIAYRW
jgi:hypothetical protein